MYFQFPISTAKRSRAWPDIEDGSRTSGHSTRRSRPPSSKPRNAHDWDKDDIEAMELRGLATVFCKKKISLSLFPRFCFVTACSFDAAWMELKEEKKMDPLSSLHWDCGLVVCTCIMYNEKLSCLHLFIVGFGLSTLFSHIKGKLGSTVVFQACSPPKISPMKRSPLRSAPKSFSFFAAICESLPTRHTIYIGASGGTSPGIRSDNSDPSPR